MVNRGPASTPGKIVLSGRLNLPEGFGPTAYEKRKDLPQRSLESTSAASVAGTTSGAGNGKGRLTHIKEEREEEEESSDSDEEDGEKRSGSDSEDGDGESFHTFNVGLAVRLSQEVLYALQHLCNAFSMANCVL
jgi:hypothetical protein